MLGVTFTTDVCVTALVMRVVFGAFKSPAYPDLERVEAASKALLARQLSNAKRKPLTAGSLLPG